MLNMTNRTKDEQYANDGVSPSFEFLKRHIKLALSVAILIWCWMLMYVLFAYKPIYGSDSLVLIKDSAITNRYVVQDQNYGLQTTSSNSSNPVLNTMGLLKSDLISESLFNFMKSRHPQELQKIKVKDLKDWKMVYGDGKAFLKAKNQAGTDLISVEFSWTKPEIAKEGLDVVLKAFQQASLNLNRAEQQSRSKYLQKQVDQIQEKLRELRQGKSEYKSKMKTVNLLEESDELARSVIELGSKLNQVEAAALGKEEEAGRMQAMLNMTPERALKATALGMNQTLNKLHDDYYKTSQTYAYLKTTLTEKNPKLQEVKAQLEELESGIRQETMRSIGEENVSPGFAVADITRGEVIKQMVAAQSEAMRLKTEAAVISERLAEIEGKIAEFPNIEQHLTRLDDEEKTLSSALSTLRQKELEAQLKEAETLSNVFIIDAPRVPVSPKFPSQKHLTVLGFMLGIVGGVVAAFLRHKSRSLKKGITILASKSVPSKKYKKRVSEQPVPLAEPIMPQPVVAASTHDPLMAPVIDLPPVDQNMNDLLPVSPPERESLLKQRLMNALTSGRKDHSA